MNKMKYIECSVCGAEARCSATNPEYTDRCDLCFYLGAKNYEQTSSTGAIIKAMCLCTNVILNEIRVGRKQCE